MAMPRHFAYLQGASDRYEGGGNSSVATVRYLEHVVPSSSHSLAPLSTGPLTHQVEVSRRSALGIYRLWTAFASCIHTYSINCVGEQGTALLN